MSLNPLASGQDTTPLRSATEEEDLLQAAYSKVHRQFRDARTYEDLLLARVSAWNVITFVCFQSPPTCFNPLQRSKEGRGENEARRSHTPNVEQEAVSCQGG